jgi:hypothetical protein
MSLLQEMESHGLADCEYNRRLLKIDARIKRLINIHLPNFNAQMEDDWESDWESEHNTDYIPLTAEQAQNSGDFIYWCNLWDDSRNELFNLLKGV